jgi:acetylornithine deacetylase
MSSDSTGADFLSGIALNEARFLELLEKLIGESEFLQNSPPQGLIPNEDRASDHVLAVLAPYMTLNGGVLEIERVSFVEGMQRMTENTSDEIFFLPTMLT